MFIILQLLIWVTLANLSCPWSDSEREASAFGGQRAGQPGSVAGHRRARWAFCVSGQWERKLADSWLTKKSHNSRFLFKQRMLSSKMPCYLGAQDFMPIPGEAHHFLTQDLRIWHLYCRRRDSFAPERQVNNCSVLSSPWRGCMLLKQPRHCCQALHYCLLSPKVSNAPALPTAGLLQGWMRHFPGQDFMNETDCVLQGKRLLCISWRRKPMWRKSASQFQQQCGGEINITDKILPESLSLSHDTKRGWPIQRPGI